jgi:hypothetical protein
MISAPVRRSRFNAPACTRPRLRILGPSLPVWLLAATAAAAPVVLDDFDDIAPWSVIASDGVTATSAAADGVAGKALRLDFDFQRGAGFCVLRRPLALPLPANYRFTFAIRGEGPDNNLEFKLVDPAGENVWWVNQRGFQFPKDWRTIAYKTRHLRFAWGPSGGKTLERVGFIEFAVSAGSGGKGSIFLDTLTFEELPPPEPVTHTPLASVSSVQEGDADRPFPLDAAGKLDWHSAPTDAAPWVEIDFRQVREFGGLVMEWAPDDYATAYEVLLSEDGAQRIPAASIDDGNGGRDYLPLPEAEARRVRVHVSATSRNRGVRLRSIQIKGPEFAQTPNGLFREIAHDARPGLYPRYYLDQQTPWTVVGVAGDTKEALLNTDGALEVDKLGFRIEPFIREGEAPGRLITWADATITQSLEEDYIPIPTVSWRMDALTLEITAFARGDAGPATLVARYRVRNTSERKQTGALMLAIRPFQVLPPWQELNITGGVSSIHTIAFEKQRVVVNGDKSVVPWTVPMAFGASTFAGGEVVEFLAAGKLPASRGVTDSAGFASAALQYAFELEPGATQTVVVSVPFDRLEHEAAWPMSESDAHVLIDEWLKEVRHAWCRELNRVEIRLPPAADKLVNTFRTTQAYILINADGPAIQPGSRSYERSWMRDGALTSTALLCTGHPEQAKAFLDWFAGHQYPNGKVPCVVDVRGPDPVPEHDSTGEFIYALLKCYRFTRDRDFLERHLSHVTAAVDYLEALRNQRLTDAYRDGPPEMRACYGLVPESISHEGYSAKPMHSYWDDFFVLKGLTDATTIAQILGRTDLEARFAALRDAFRTSLYDSMRLAMRIKKIDFVPGCVELGDFDATSTAIGVFPCGQLGAIPEPQLTNTFDRYWEFFTKRRDGAREWQNYTPYEVRLVGTFMYLGRPERAHELLKFFFRDQSPPAWNQWAEVVWRDPAVPRFIGDMPHTWVGSDYLNAVRSMFVYERERDDALVLAAGVLNEWVETSPGVAIDRFPTEHGLLSYTLTADTGRMVLELRSDLTPPPAKLVFVSPDLRPIQSVTIDDHPHTAFRGREIELPSARANVVINYVP